MNRLLAVAPTTLTVNGAEYVIRPDFRTVLSILNAFDEENVTEKAKLSFLIEELFVDLPPVSDWPEACTRALWFITCGREATHRHGKSYLNFDDDAEYIHSALTDKLKLVGEIPDMHWWTFCGHISELPECRLTRIMHLRQRMAEGNLTKDEKKQIQNIGMAVLRPETKGGAETTKALREQFAARMGAVDTD